MRMYTIKGMIVPSIERRRCPDNKEVMTYAVYVVTFEPMTGQPKPAEVGYQSNGRAGPDRGMAAQILGWKRKSPILNCF